MKITSKTKQESPIQFRPGPELRQILIGFAAEHGLSMVESAKALIALAACGMDVRSFALLRQMATAMGGLNCFTASCLHIHNAVLGAERVRGKRLPEPERAQFVLETVADYMATAGATLDYDSVSYPPSSPSPAVTQPVVVKRRRTILPHVKED